MRISHQNIQASGPFAGTFLSLQSPCRGRPNLKSLDSDARTLPDVQVMDHEPTAPLVNAL